MLSRHVRKFIPRLASMYSEGMIQLDSPVSPHLAALDASMVCTSECHDKIDF